MWSPPPKMPHLMTHVYAQIRGHDRFSELSRGTKIGFDAAVYGLSWTTRANNKWCRDIWRCLYLDTPMPDGESIFDIIQ